MKKRIVVVSLFSGMDLFLLAMVKSGMLPGFACERNFYASLLHASKFKHVDGKQVMEFISISPEEYVRVRTDKGSEETVGIVDGKHYRTISIQEVNGYDIRSRLETKYGQDVIIILIGGPPCQDFTLMNRNRNVDGKDSRNQLVFEYLRVLGELQPDVALMEEVTDFISKKFEKTFTGFINEAQKLPYSIAYQKMNALHYGGRQSRERVIFMFTLDLKNLQPAFPFANTENIIRVRDFLDIDHFFSGHYIDRIKTKNDYMCTVTSGSPAYFEKNWVRRTPTIQELLLCMDVEEGDYPITDGIPFQQVRKAIGNGVCVSLGKALAEIIIKKVLKLRHVGDSYFLPLEDCPEDSPGIDNSPVEIGSGPGNKNEHCKDRREAIVVPCLLDTNGNDGSDLGDTAEVNSSNMSAAPIVDDCSVNLPAVNPFLDATKLEPSIVQPVTTKLRIINSAELRKMQFEELDFTGKWKELIGRPSKTFHCVVHGMSGHGKSTMSIQFAQYLADNFGRVLFVSGEEGFSLTFKNKFVFTGAVSERLDVADITSYPEFMSEVPKKGYDYIFLDSLDTMKINAQKLRHLRKEFSGCALITVSQATKAGEMRGSYEIVHDSDIAIEVVDGVATTSKNRFKEKGATYKVF